MARDEEYPRVDWDELDGAHAFVMVSPLVAGRSCYLCENCGAFTIHRNDRVILWHNPRREDTSCEPRTAAGTTLKQKLNELDARDWNALSKI